MFKFEIQILLNICNLAHNFKFFRNLKFRQILRNIWNKHGVYIVKPPCLGLAEVYLRYYTETQWDIRNPFIQKAFSYLNCLSYWNLPVWPTWPRCPQPWPSSRWTPWLSWSAHWTGAWRSKPLYLNKSTCTSRRSYRGGTSCWYWLVFSSSGME